MLGQFALHDTGIDAGNAQVAVLLTQAFADGMNGILGRAIDGGHREYVQRRNRGDVDDLPLTGGDHFRQDGSHAVQNPANVHVDHAVPFVELERIDARQGHKACIVDDHVHCTETGACGIRKAAHSVAVGHIDRMHQNFTRQAGG